MLKQKKYLFFANFIIFLFGAVNFASAVEVTSGPCAGSTDISSCVVSLFKWSIGIAGALALVSFTIGAITLVASGSNAELSSSAKDRMKGSILGLVLIGASFIIMNSINTAITNPTIAPLNNPTIAPVNPVPGVYFYSDTGCQSPLSSSSVSLTAVGAGVKAIQIIDDSTKNINYGYILHQVTDLKKGGPCGQPVTTASCQPVNGMYGAIDIFKINSDAATSGTGVTFYSKPYGLDRGASAGFVHQNVGSQVTFDPGTQFSYTGVDVPDEYKNTECKKFSDCPGSMDLQGDYLVAIYTSGGSGSGSYCQTFTDNVTNFNSEPIVASGAASDALSSAQIYIWPTGGVSNNSSNPTP